MGEKLWQLLCAGWRSLGFVAAIIGILYLWPDIRDLPEAYDSDWGQAMSWLPERETAAFIALGLALLWIVWIDIRPTVRRWLSERKQQPIFLECHPARLPEEPPAKGFIYTLDVGRPDVEVLDLGQQHERSDGQKWEWHFASGVYRCDITNLGATPLFNLQLVFTISFYELEVDRENPAASRTGDLVLERQRHVRIAALLPNQPFSFYAYNQSGYIAEVGIPATAVIHGTEDRETEVRLVVAGWGRMVMFPREMAPAGPAGGRPRPREGTVS